MAEPLQLDKDHLTSQESGSSSIPSTPAITKTKGEMAGPSSQLDRSEATVTTEPVTRRGKGSSKNQPIVSKKGKQKLSKPIANKVEFVEKKEFDLFKEEVLDMKSMLKDFIEANKHQSETEQKEAEEDEENEEGLKRMEPWHILRILQECQKKKCLKLTKHWLQELQKSFAKA